MRTTVSAALAVLMSAAGAAAAPAAIRLTPKQLASHAVTVGKALRRPFRDTLEVLGSVASEPEKVEQVRAAAPGRVSELMVSLGDAVSAGQPLLGYAEEGGTRTVAILAPRSGAVVGLFAEAGGHVDPAVPLVTLADTTQLRCILEVFEKDIARVRKGQGVRLRSAAFPAETFEGRVIYISPRVNEASRTIKVRVDLANPKGLLKFGMFMEGEVVVGERSAFLLPETAIQTVEGKPGVLVSSDGASFYLREVRTGAHLRDGSVEVVSGLKDGESVVLQGGFILLAENDKDSQ